MARKFSRKDFLEALFGDYFLKREGFIMVRAIRRLDARVSTRYFPNLEILAKEPYDEDQNVFFGVCPHETMKAERAQISYITAVWAGLDFNSSGYSGANTYFSNKSQAAKAIRSFPLPPSIIVESGWGVHLYWLLKEVMPLTSIETAERLLARVNNYFLCQTTVKIDSVMRLPGTFNGRVPGQLANCFVKYVNHDFRYTLDDFADLDVSLDGPIKHDGGEAVSDEPMGGQEDVAGRTAFLGDEEPGELPGGRLWEPPSGVYPSPRMRVPGHIVPNLQRDGSDGMKDVGSSTKEAAQAAPRTEIVEAVEAEELSDTLAEEIADKVVEKLSTELADKLADQIVDRLYRLLNGK
ncbi:MAG: hypothetical protein HY913_06505 [Desulfomonile tiedjei]|nr:hypothetical protein [Desulfomonile tiedjei]